MDARRTGCEACPGGSEQRRIHGTLQAPNTLLDCGAPTGQGHSRDGASQPIPSRGAGRIRPQAVRPGRVTAPPAGRDRLRSARTSHGPPPPNRVTDAGPPGNATAGNFRRRTPRSASGGAGERMDPGGATCPAGRLPWMVRRSHRAPGRKPDGSRRRRNGRPPCQVGPHDGGDAACPGRAETTPLRCPMSATAPNNPLSRLGHGDSILRRA